MPEEQRSGFGGIVSTLVTWVPQRLACQPVNRLAAADKGTLEESCARQPEQSSVGAGRGVKARDYFGLLAVNHPHGFERLHEPEVARLQYQRRPFIASHGGPPESAVAGPGG